MPRKNPLSADELGVCNRLRQFREHHGFSRMEFCRRLGLSWRSFANYESGRVKVPFFVAAGAAQRFGLNLRWLAENIYPMEAFQLPDPLPVEIEGRSPFLQAYRNKLQPVYKAYFQVFQDLQEAQEDIKSLAQGKKIAPPSGRTPSGGVVLWVPQKEWVPALRLRAENLRAIAEKLSMKAADIEFAIADAEGADIKTATPPHQDIADKASKPIVDSGTAAAKIGAVSAKIRDWKTLVERTAAVTAAPGAKAQLARDLNITRQAVNKWLSGAGAPSADLTLRLLHQVEAMLATQKSPGAVGSSAKAKTRKRKSSSHENPKSNPR